MISEKRDYYASRGKKKKPEANKETKRKGASHIDERRLS